MIDTVAASSSSDWSSDVFASRLRGTHPRADVRRPARSRARLVGGQKSVASEASGGVDVFQTCAIP